jgi:corrinoid protein of di/trimethylamine methyltransferase
MSDYSEMHEAVISGRNNDTAQMAQEFLDAGHAPENILYDGLLPGMEEVGRRFESGEFFIPEMLLAARALNAGLDVVKPLLKDEDTGRSGKVVVGTVKGDIHDIGKNLVAIMLEGGGFQVIDAGVDVAPQEFARLIREHNPDLVGMSALLTTTMPAMEETIKVLQSEGVRDSVKVLIGGAPVTKDYAERIGADGYGQNASAAVGVAKQLVA